MGRPVMTLPLFWLLPEAKALALTPDDEPATAAAAPPPPLVATADVLGLGAAAPFSPTTYGTDADVSASMMMSRNRKHSRR